MWFLWRDHSCSAATAFISHHAGAGADAEFATALHFFVGSHFAEGRLLRRCDGVVLIEIFQHFLVGPSLTGKRKNEISFLKKINYCSGSE